MILVRKLQGDVNRWVRKCFGHDIAMDKVERNQRFIEEALELVQACGGSRDDCRKLVDYVFDRPSGTPRQEVGGVVVTLMALATAQSIDVAEASADELNRVWGMIDKIRAKQATKPHQSPYPVPMAHGMSCVDPPPWDGLEEFEDDEPLEGGSDR